jgi:hypothetical protein
VEVQLHAFYTLTPASLTRGETPCTKHTHRIRGWIDPSLLQHDSKRKKEIKKERKKEGRKERKKARKKESKK